MASESFNPEIVDVMPGYTPGAILWDDAGRAYCYIEASANLSAAHVALWSTQTFTGTLTTSTNMSGNGETRRLGVVMATIPEGSYGWAQVYGPGRMMVNGAVSQTGTAYTSGTPGQLNDSSSGQSRTRNIIFTSSAAGAGLIDVELNWPGGDNYV